MYFFSHSLVRQQLPGQSRECSKQFRNAHIRQIYVMTQHFTAELPAIELNILFDKRTWIRYDLIGYAI
jgi:hypothetical protein